jgi:hypothetical protein
MEGMKRPRTFPRSGTMPRKTDEQKNQRRKPALTGDKNGKRFSWPETA